MRLTILLTICLLVPSLWQLETGQSKTALDQPTQALELHHARSIDAFRQILAGAGVPGGIVVFGDPLTEPSLDFLMPAGKSLRETMNSLVEVDPRYRWETDKGVVNVLPIVNRQSILDLRIEAFSSRDAKDVNLALEHLLQKSEIKERISQLGLTQAPREFGPTSVQKAGSESISPVKRVSVECKEATVRQALNSIARADGKAIWIYEEFQQQGRPVFRIYFGVR